MLALRKALTTMTAADVMSHDVVMIPRQMSLRAVARLFSRSQISGAPVVDEMHRCVGVLSASDFVRWTEVRMAPPSADETPATSVCEWQMPELKDLPTDSVEYFMTADPVTVAPSTPLPEVARKMIDAHIHRVIVVEDWGRPIGIVSSTDVLAAVAALPLEN